MLIFFSFISFKVTFINESTGEFQFYELTFRATKPGTISTIHLTTPVRQSVPHTVTVENPLSYQVTFSISCSVPEVLMPNQLIVPANSQVWNLVDFVLPVDFALVDF